MPTFVKGDVVVVSTGRKSTSGEGVVLRVLPDDMLKIKLTDSERIITVDVSEVRKKKTVAKPAKNVVRHTSRREVEEDQEGDEDDEYDEDGEDGEKKDEEKKVKKVKKKETPVKRGPGRPRKNVEKVKEEETPVKRGRGRPRKNVEKVKEEETPVKRGRGRPRKNLEKVKEEETPVKRGRGRPRKNVEEPVVKIATKSSANIAEIKRGMRACAKMMAALIEALNEL